MTSRVSSDENYATDTQFHRKSIPEQLGGQGSARGGHRSEGGGGGGGGPRRGGGGPDRQSGATVELGPGTREARQGE